MQALFQKVQEFGKRFGLHIRRYTPVSDSIDVLLYHARQRNVQTVIDVGANIGQFGSRIITGGWDGNILSVEPLSDAHAKLSQLASKARKWSVAPRCALGAAQGQATINISRSSPSSSLLGAGDRLQEVAPQAEFIGQEVVDIRTLEDVITATEVAPTPYLLKMDVQGYEDKVLAGCGSSLEKIQAIYTEMSLIQMYDGELNFAELSMNIFELGFNCIAIHPGYFSRYSHEITHVDALFVRNR